MQTAKNYYEGYRLECPTCYFDLLFNPMLKPDGSADCYLGTRSCLRCHMPMEIGYCKDTNEVLATVKENDCE